MRIFLKAAALFFFAVAGTAVPPLCAQHVSVQIKNLRSDKGQVIIQAFRDRQGFEQAKPYKVFKFSKKAVSGGMLRVRCDLPPGTYGLALLDDENGNGRMDNNMLKMPKEGFAFSDYYLSGMSRPRFEDFHFRLDQEPVKVEMKLRYL